MTHLEPRFEEAGIILFDELEEVHEVILIMNGKFDLGFEINGKKIYVIRYTNSTSSITNAGEIIGDYSCSLNKQCRFIYKTKSFCDGFFIRKRNWLEVMNRNSYVSKSLMHNIIIKYNR